MAAPISKKLKMDKNNHIEKDNRTQDDIIDISCYVLTNFPQILKLIFRCLPAKSLNCCARVCKVWDNVAQKIKQSRFPFYWNYFECDEDDEDSQQQLVESIQYTIENLSIQPETMIIFYSLPLLDLNIHRIISKTKTRSQRRVQRESTGVSVFFQELLPYSCQMTAVVTDGVVGTSSDLKKTEEIENLYALSFICFAKQSNFSYHPMLFDDDEGTQLGELWNSNEETCCYLQSLKSVKSLLFFTDTVTCPQEFAFALFKEYNQPLISGAFVESLIIPKIVHSKGAHVPTISCVALCGENVKIASVIIKDDIYTKPEVEECMKELKSHHLPEEKSFAFMFACVGRGQNHYGEENVESVIFRKYFPKTPLLGLFGRGEVGFKYPLPLSVSKSLETVDKDDEVSNVSQKYLTHPPKLYHAYTTVLCLVSLP